MFSVAAFYLHNFFHFDGRLNKARNISAFAALSAFSFGKPCLQLSCLIYSKSCKWDILALLVLLLSRTLTGSLYSDFSTLGDQGVVESVIILVTFSFLLGELKDPLPLDFQISTFYFPKLSLALLQRLSVVMKMQNKRYH